MRELKVSLLETYISILHGLEGIVKNNREAEPKIKDYVMQIYFYLDHLVSTEAALDNTMIRYIFEVFIDIVSIYRPLVQDEILGGNLLKQLREGLKSL